MNLSTLTAISPIDGRYRNKLKNLDDWFSEFGLIKLRVRIEIEYVLALLKVLGKDTIVDKPEELRSIWINFSIEDALWIKKKEEEIKHDIKVIEYFLQEKLSGEKNKAIIPFIHLGLTSEDITTSAYALALSECNQTIILPLLQEIDAQLQKIIQQTGNFTMLARTHGQPAVPTTIGKELKNFSERIRKIISEIEHYSFESKLNGAVGNFNALVATYPAIDWIKFSDMFIANLGLVPNHFTTQILPYDNWLTYFSKLKLANSILTGFCQDIWRYISDNYFIQILKAQEVGSSTMPQKVNPIDFENAEGNLGIANSLFAFYENKLAISRLQRDLSDSTVKRTFGTSLAHTILAYNSILTGLKKINPNQKKLQEELENHWEVISEGIQTILRAEGMPDAYEKLKTLTRGKAITKDSYEEFLTTLTISDEARNKLKNLSPHNYIGLAETLVHNT